MIFQILGEEEINFDLKGFYRFKDLETQKEIELQAEGIKDEFKTAALAYLKNLEEALRIPNVNLIRVTLNEPIARVIAESLKKRKL